MNQFIVEYYEKEDGSYPVEEFLLSLDIKMRAKVFRNLELLEIKGNQLREPHLEDGIFELRVKLGKNITRVLYFFVIGNKVILTNGFIKKTQKTPRSEIKLAKQYREDYQRRSYKNE